MVSKVVTGKTPTSARAKTFAKSKRSPIVSLFTDGASLIARQPSLRSVTSEGISAVGQIRLHASSAFAEKAMLNLFTSKLAEFAGSLQILKGFSNACIIIFITLPCSIIA